MASTVRNKQDRKALARAYADQIVLSGIARVSSTLRLGELAQQVAQTGISMEDLRRLLTTNPHRFAYHERRWVPASRVVASQAPLNELIYRTIETYGGPMSLSDLAAELGAAKKRPAEAFLARLPAMLNADPGMFATESGLAGLTKWLFMAHDESPEEALYKNDMTYEDVEPYERAFSRIDFEDLQSAARAALKHAPISPKVPGYFAWCQLNPDDPYFRGAYDAVALFDALMAQKDFVFGADGQIYPASEAPTWLREALRDAERAKPVIQIEEAAPLELTAEDIETMVQSILDSDESFSVSEMLERKYELTPAERTYSEDLANAVAALKRTERVWFVGGDRFRRPESAPEFIYSVPEFFHFPKSEFRDEDGELIDVELSDDGFSSALRKEMGHPLAMDVLDEDPQPKPRKQPEQLRLVLKSLHREIGTFPLCQIPPGWLDPDPPIQELVFVDPSGKQLNVWVNFEARLMFNLLDWWFEQPVESGAVFTLTKTQRPNVLEFRWEDETDPILFISSERMEELRDLATRSGDFSNYEILMDVLGKYPKGADYITILAEANVVRRMTRRMVASILSGYHCFYQRSGSPVWHFDPKKVDQGFDKAKRKYIRK